MTTDVAIPLSMKKMLLFPEQSDRGLVMDLDWGFFVVVVIHLYYTKRGDAGSDSRGWKGNTTVDEMQRVLMKTSLSFSLRRFRGGCRCTPSSQRSFSCMPPPHWTRQDGVHTWCFLPPPPPLSPPTLFLSLSRFYKPNMFTTSVSCLQLPWQRG